MKHKMYAIHDSAAKAYLPPFITHQEGIAIRTFQDAVNDKTHPFGKNPKDYTLMQIAEFDDENGKLTPLQTQLPLGNGLSFVLKSEDSDQLQLLEDISA